MHTLSPAPVSSPKRQVRNISLTSPLPADTTATRRVRLAGGLIAVLVCACHAYANRHLINPDGICYLDLAAAYQRGDWSAAVNAYWSPLYSWLLAAVFAVVRPELYWECAVAHAVNFASFLLAWGAFEGLLSELLRGRRTEREWLGEAWHDLLPDWLVVGVGYTLFIVVARRLVTVSAVTPDMLVLAGAVAASWLLLRLRRTRSARDAALLGAVLGLAYLAKAVMFPLAFVYLGVALLMTRRGGPRPFVLALAGFVVLAGPWVAVLTVSRGKPTFGESGRLNYLWYVNGLPHPNQLARRHTPLTPRDPQPLSRAPLLTRCEPEAGETTPLWHDPARFYEGITPSFDLRQQAFASGKVVAFYYSLFVERFLGWTMAVLVLVGYGYFAGRIGWLRRWAGSCWRCAAMLLPALAGLTLYLVVGHAEGRLVGPFVLLLGLGLLATVSLPHPRPTAARPFGAAMLMCLAGVVGMNALFDVATAYGAAGESPGAHLHARVAAELRALGVAPGEKVVSIGFTYNAYWARLGRYPVVAEMPLLEAPGFWAAPPAEKTRVLNACRLVGARAIVCDCAPRGADGWHAVPGTAYSVRLLEDPERPSPTVAKAD